MPKNEDCVVKDSVLCRWIDKDCADCYIKGFKDKDDARDALAGFETTLSLLPDDIDELQGEDCCFCVGEKQKRAGYAIIDLAHSEPASKKGMFFGLGKKVRQRIGSLMPISVSICKPCRRNFWLYDIIKWLTLIVFVGIGIGLCLMPAINQSPALPYAVVLAAAVIGYIVGKLLTSVFLKAKSSKTRFNIFDIPICAKMQENGWFTVQDNDAVTHMLFSKKSMMKKVAGIYKGLQCEPTENTQAAQNKD